MAIIKWIKTWGTLLVAVSAIGLSAFAIYINNVHYQDVTKPHAIHDIIYDRLVILDNNIERTEQDIRVWQGMGQDTSEYQSKLIYAKTLLNQAELSWDKGQYSDADGFIREAHDVLLKIPIPPLPPPKGPNWLLILGIIAGVALLAIYIFLLARRGKLKAIRWPLPVMRAKPKKEGKEDQG